MNSKLWIQKALTMCSMVALVATCSMVTLASTGKAVGELTVIGSAGETSFVTVNGEPSTSGRTVFSSSTVATPEGMGAAVNFGKAGKVEFGASTTFTINFDGNAIGGDLTSGSITVLSAAQTVVVKTLSGEIVELKAGETAMATSARAAVDYKDSTGTCIDDDKDGDLECGNGGIGWYALILGGAAVAILLAATADNDADFGAGATTISPVR